MTSSTELIINSKKNGKFICLIDDDDLVRLKSEFKNLKWTVSHARYGFYFQKRLSTGKLIYLHRYIVNAPDGTYVDHINGNTLDNRKCNLRITNNADNVRNGKIRINNSTGINGVYFRKERNRFIATIKVNYKKINLGSFKTLEEATNARKLAEIKYWNTWKEVVLR